MPAGAGAWLRHAADGYQQDMDAPTFTMTAIPIVMIAVIALWWGRRRGSESRSRSSDSARGHHDGGRG